MITANEIRQRFLDFFSKRGHRVVASSPVVPHDDPTLLFTNAGMNQFKDVFLGREKRDYARAATSQKCIRAGGKHNDLEQVGHTARHQTFFEMLGNFSFGDYFKKDAIAYAWEFLTNDLALPRERLWITIYKDDDEAGAIWREVTGFPDSRIVRLGEKDNFWQMGDTGPCGPCTEIHFDRGPGWRGDHARAPGEGSGERFMEIWNNVFMQYDRQADGQGGFTLVPLPKPSVDTGMGLERVTAVLQDVESNYETDLLRPLIDATARISGQAYDPGEKGVPHRVIADHLRALSFAFADGALPSNEGRGYVLRRILRRAVNYGRRLGFQEPFLAHLVPTLIAMMGAQYPELGARKEHLEHLLTSEEESFGKTIDNGLQRFERAAHQLIENEHADVFPGELAFELYATYGFPPDLTRLLAAERRLGFDEPGFEKRLEEHVATSQAAGGSKFKAIDLSAHGTVPETVFVGYTMTEAPGEVASFSEPRGELILTKTPFYAESGGQVGDQGAIEAEDGSFRFRVRDTKKAGGVIVHLGALEQGAQEQVKPGARVKAAVDRARRERTMKNHTATHLLHWALHQVIGEHAKQAGSVVDPERLRFDFSHPQAMTEEEVERVERMVNEKVIANSDVAKYERSLDEARRAGVTALFGEKYGERVRVVDINGFSRELCGGTHVSRTGDIGPFKIVQETAVQAGVRRIVAITGPATVDWMIEQARRGRELSRGLAVPEEKVGDRVKQLLDQVRELKHKAKQAPKPVAAAAGSSREEQIGGRRVVVEAIVGAGQDELRARWDAIKATGPVAAILVGDKESKVGFIAAATKDGAPPRWKDAVEAAAKAHGGRAGGRADMVQGGLGEKSSIEPFIDAVLIELKK